MGLSRAAVAWLIEESQRRPFEGSLLTLGLQNVFLSQTEFEAVARRMGATLLPPPEHPDAPLIEGTVTAKHVFRRLGFDRVVSTDIDDFEDCDLVFDLNSGIIPEEHRGAYDMVLDSGTLEHVFHVPNALSNLLAFAGDRGRIVHLSPSSNHIDHGFWMFSPTLFWDYYTANGLDLPTFELFRYASPADRTGAWLFGNYRPDALRKQMFGGLGGGCFGIAVVAEKMSHIAEPVIPQQGMYAAAWSGKAAPGLPSGSTMTGKPTFRAVANRLRQYLWSLLPAEWQILQKAMSRRFPLPIRRRF